MIGEVLGLPQGEPRCGPSANSTCVAAVVAVETGALGPRKEKRYDSRQIGA